MRRLRSWRGNATSAMPQARSFRVRVISAATGCHSLLSFRSASSAHLERAPNALRAVKRTQGCLGHFVNIAQHASITVWRAASPLNSYDWREHDC